MKIYSNENNIKLIASMTAKGREPHSIVICGEKGQGRKTLAKYIAAQLMCEKKGERPCGSCRTCRMIEHDSHPDLITVSPNENGNYQADVIRSMAADAAIKPNDSDFKVYIIPDLDRSVNTAVQVQNILLKLIEEPPSYCVIILTAASKEIFLKTIISRVLCLTAEPCTPQQAEEWLSSQGEYSNEQIARAVECCHGNFGRCAEFIQGGVLPEAYGIAVACTDAMIKRDEYEILKALFKADGKKAVMRQSLVFLSEIARDCCAARLGIKQMSGCYKKGSAKLAETLDEVTSQQLYELFCGYTDRIDSNCNLTLTMNSLTGEICGLINRKATERNGY
ncbi:MAG: hypothetical protein ACI4JA_02785 [Oscillospiraceae bacterium]